MVRYCLLERYSITIHFFYAPGHGTYRTPHYVHGEDIHICQHITILLQKQIGCADGIGIRYLKLMQKIGRAAEVHSLSNLIQRTTP